MLGRTAALALLVLTGILAAGPAVSQSQNFLKDVGEPQNEYLPFVSEVCDGDGRYISVSMIGTRHKIKPGGTFRIKTLILNCAGKDLTPRYHIRYYMVPLADAPINTAELKSFLTSAPKRSGSFRLGSLVETNTCLALCDSFLESQRVIKWDSTLTGSFVMLACPANTGGINKGLGLAQGDVGRVCSADSVVEVTAADPAVDAAAASLVVTREYWEDVPLTGTVQNSGTAPLGLVGNSARFSATSYPIRPSGFESERVTRQLYKRSFLQGSGLRSDQSRVLQPTSRNKNRLAPRLLSNGTVPEAMMFDFSMAVALTGDQDGSNNNASLSVRAVPNKDCELALFWPPQQKTRSLVSDKAPGFVFFWLANTGKIGCKKMQYVVMRRILSGSGSVIDDWSPVGTAKTSPLIPRLSTRAMQFNDATPVGRRGLVQYTLQVIGPHPDERHFNHQGARSAMTLRVR